MVSHRRRLSLSRDFAWGTRKPRCLLRRPRICNGSRLNFPEVLPQDHLSIVMAVVVLLLVLTTPADEAVLVVLVVVSRKVLVI